MPIGVSSAPYAKFARSGDRHGGRIVDFRVVQTMDYDTKRPNYLQENLDGGWSKTFSPFRSDGKPNDPICQWEITVDTGVEDENGDTERRIFVDPRKGRKNTLLEGKRGGDAVAVALKKTKAHRVGLEIGGEFYLIAGEKVRDGSGPLTNTWSAEYVPPDGGPGTGKPVDETPWLIGGARYDKTAEMARWKASQDTAHAVTTSIRPTEPATDDGDPGLQERQREARERLARGHKNLRPADDEEPPF